MKTLRKIEKIWKLPRPMNPTLTLLRFMEMENGTSLNSTCLTPKPLAPSVYVHVPEAPSPHERSILVTSLFPSLVPFPLPTIAGAGVVRAFSLAAWADTRGHSHSATREA